MTATYKQMTDYLVDMGIEKVPHTQKSYLAHLIALHRFLKDEGYSDELCRAGMFHSIYGTQLFQGFKLDVARRREVRELIGERAEKLAYLNCAMQRETFDAALQEQSGPMYRFTDRLTGEEVVLDQEDFDDLTRIHMYDWLEQVARTPRGYGYRRRAYRRMAERLGDKALAAYDRVFAQETVAAR